MDRYVVEMSDDPDHEVDPLLCPACKAVVFDSTGSFAGDCEHLEFAVLCDEGEIVFESPRVVRFVKAEELAGGEPDIEFVFDAIETDSTKRVDVTLEWPGCAPAETTLTYSLVFNLGSAKVRRAQEKAETAVGAFELAHPDTRARALQSALLCYGARRRRELIAEAAQGLKTSEDVVVDALNRGLKQGLFDRPKRGFVRAIYPEPGEYTEDDWIACVVNSLDLDPCSEHEACKRAFSWAQKKVGLDRKSLRRGSKIYRSLLQAVRTAVAEGKLLRDGENRVWRESGPRPGAAGGAPRAEGGTGGPPIDQWL